MKQDNIGIAVVGSGRIGALRARLAAKHPAVRFLAVSDRDPARARALAEAAGADVHSGSNEEVIAHPQVTAVIVSTPERQHTQPILQALKLGKPVLVEKPIGFSLREADQILDSLRATKGELRVGYSRRYKECFLRAKEQMLHGRLGKVVGGMARVYNSRAQAFAILKRDPHATPVLDVLTYYVDLMCWFLEGNRPVEVVARGQHGIFKEAGYGAHDATWAIVTFADGAVIDLGVSYALPARYPTLGQSDRVELLGSEGTMIIDDDHRAFAAEQLHAVGLPQRRVARGQRVADPETDHRAVREGQNRPGHVLGAVAGLLENAVLAARHYLDRPIAFQEPAHQIDVIGEHVEHRRRVRIAFENRKRLRARIVDARHAADHLAEAAVQHLLLGAQKAFLVAAAIADPKPAPRGAQ